MTSNLAIESSEASIKLERAIELHQSGNLEAAETLYREILDQDPNDLGALNNLGCVNADAGRFAAAADCFRKVIDARPTDQQALENLGKALIRSDALAEAEAVLKGLVELYPKSANALSLLGGVFRDRGNAASAFNMQWRAVQADPNHDGFWTSFVSTFAQLELNFVHDEERLREILLACLLKDGVDHQSLARIAAEILKRDETFKRLTGLALASESQSLMEEFYQEDTLRALSDRLVLTVLKQLIVPDIGFERTLTGLRRFLLSMAVRDEAERHWAFTNPELIYALAQHCFLNGYVFAESDEEVDKFNSLIAELSARKLTTSRFDRARVGVVACYVRLLDWDKAAEIWESANEDPDPDYSQMLMKQIENPIHELQLREVIPGVGDITDEVSKKVQSLYEEHPYPRWESYSRVQPKPVEAVVRDLFPDFHLERLEVGDPPKILVAGCGTGKQLMLAWSRFHNAELVGIDLSVSSLAYALRKLKENSIENVALIHGDILDLKEWSEPLDVIECVGVLHHMDDPLEGWRILSHLLKPGGLMRIGLYSSLARREIANVREFIAKLGLEATEEDIRRGRQEIIEHLLDKQGHELLNAGDFHSLHGARDLLFHVQEHRFTLPQISDICRELSLEFLGFEFANWRTRAAFRERYPKQGAERSLELWHEFEQANPLTFTGMYQFWVLKEPLG